MRTNPLWAPRNTAAPFLCALTLALAADAPARDIPKSELVRIVAPDSGPDDAFGFSIAAFGGTLVVGAPGNDNRAGAAYVFVRQSATNWVLQAKLVAPDGAFEDHFGRVAISGDTIVVTNGFNQRAAHFFFRNGSTWTRRQRTALAGNPPLIAAVDGPRVILLSQNTGNAYPYRRTSSLTWVQQTTLRADTGEPGFRSVQMADGMAVLGAPYSPRQPIGVPGSAYVFTATTVNGKDQWTRAARLRPTGFEGDPDDFGVSVDIGQQRVLVGSDMEGGFFTGAAYFFARQANGTWQQMHRMVPVVGGTRCMGTAVALHFDVALVNQPCVFRDQGLEEISVDIFGRDPATSTWSRLDRVRDPEIGDAIALSTCGKFIGIAIENAVYIQPATSC